MTTSLGEYFVNKCLEATTQTDPWPYAQFPDALPADSFNKLKKSIVNIDRDRLKDDHNKDADRKSFTKDDFPSFKEFTDSNSAWRKEHSDPRTGGLGQFAQWVDAKHKSNNTLQNPTYLYPAQWKEWGIDFVDEIYEIGQAVLDNARALCDKFPKYHWYEKRGLNVHLKVDPPAPFEYYIHTDNIFKTWTSIIYIDPDENEGTELYSAKEGVVHRPKAFGDRTSNPDDFNFIKKLPWKPNTNFTLCSDLDRTYHSYSNPSDQMRFTLCMFQGKYKANGGFFIEDKNKPIVNKWAGLTIDPSSKR
jgi:hypothetical protein